MFIEPVLANRLTLTACRKVVAVEDSYLHGSARLIAPEVTNVTYHITVVATAAIPPVGSGATPRGKSPTQHTRLDHFPFLLR